MKIAINRCFGGFGLPEHIYDQVTSKMPKNMDMEYDWREFRTFPELISLIEKEGGVITTSYSKVVVVSIPDNATDWEIDEYDGNEHIICVVDGKIQHIYE